MSATWVEYSATECGGDLFATLDEPPAHNVPPLLALDDISALPHHSSTPPSSCATSYTSSPSPSYSSSSSMLPPTSDLINDTGGTPSSSSSGTSPRRRRPPRPATATRSSRRNNPNHIGRPPNAWILYRSHICAEKIIDTSIEHDHRHLSRIIAHCWHALTNEQKKFWFDKAEEMKAEHERKYPHWRFEPTPRAKKPIKRNVKRNSDSDLKRIRCIANFVLEGKQGEELQEAVSQMDTSLAMLSSGEESGDGEQLPSPTQNLGAPENPAVLLQSYSAVQPDNMLFSGFHSLTEPPVQTEFPGVALLPEPQLTHEFTFLNDPAPFNSCNTPGPGGLEQSFVPQLESYGQLISNSTHTPLESTASFDYSTPFLQATPFHYPSAASTDEVYHPVLEYSAMHVECSSMIQPLFYPADNVVEPLASPEMAFPEWNVF